MSWAVLWPILLQCGTAQGQDFKWVKKPATFGLHLVPLSPYIGQTSALPSSIAFDPIARMDSLVSPDVREVLESERNLLMVIHSLLGKLEADEETIEQIRQVAEHLEELFLVVVVGEFNSGKSSVLNALFGEKIMEEGPIPTTAKITIVRYGEEPVTRQLSEFVVEKRHPAELLKHLNLVDTPGTNSIVRRHQEITEDFIPRADLILFITSFDRPLSESERQFLSFIRESWGKRLIFILNKVDLADSTTRELEQVLDYLQKSTLDLLGFEPRIFPVSAELAYAAKTSENEAERERLYEQSRFGPLESFLNKSLTGREQLALKLSAPLDTASKLLVNVDKLATDRHALLEEDRNTLDRLNEYFERSDRELREGYFRYVAEIDNLLLQMERRGVQFLEDNIRVSKLRLLRDRDAFKEEFNRQVIRFNDREIEDRLTAAVDWLLRRVVELWNWTLTRFRAQPRVRTPHQLTAESEFQYNRAEVFENIRREAERRIAAYDLNEEARRILENARSAAAMFVGAEGLAAGIGAIAAIVIATTAVDVTGGFIAAGALAFFGFFFLPRQKRKAVQEFRERIDHLRADLEKALRTQFDREIELALERVRSLVEPFVQFVRREEEVLKSVVEDKKVANEEIRRIRSSVEKKFGAPTVTN